MSSHAGCLGSRNTEIKSKRIRIYPTSKQRNQLRNWFNASRWFFNKAKEIYSSSAEKLSKFKLAELVIAKTPEWAKKVPYQIKRAAIFDYFKAKQNAILKYKKTQQIQEIHFRSRKNPCQSCYIPKTAVKRQGAYYTILGELEAAEPLATEIDSRILCENGRWYLTVGYNINQTRENQADSMVSIDPGVRTFVTFYAGNCCGKLGEQDIQRIYRLCLNLDNLIGKRDHVKKHRKRLNMKRAIWRIRNKISNLLDEMHHKIALFLCLNFKTILLPTFETKPMTAREKRKITTRTARKMLTLSHYKFKSFLKQKAKEMGVDVVEVCEAYTSKTCSWNGKIKEIGGAKWIADGKTVVDRDYNGARNIMLRALRDNSLSVVE
jgi:putative transposase